ncbi:MAG: two component transcriptional regulator, LytTR family [Clostridia bacterium]|jgi:DNA-binding LytR/AlgR family response regulator|nr:two component transcriptional regulator, LytTR family [Clostridia bacterium]
MQLVIGVCDDNSVQVEAISDFLVKNIKAYKLQIIKAFSGEELLSRLEKTAADVVFLDIEMSGINGLEVGKRIKGKYPGTIIIFITGYTKFALDAFKIRTMDYLVKPVTENRLSALLDDLIIRLDQIKFYEERNKIVCFRFRDNIIKLKYNDIFYFEKHLRKITVYSEKGEFSFYESMDKLLQRLDLEQFVRCHNSFLVNKTKILRLENDSIYIQELNRTIPVSKKNKLLIREILEKNLFI